MSSSAWQVLRTAEHEHQRQADQAQRAAEHERQRLERLELHRPGDEHELQRLAVLRTDEHERQRQAGQAQRAAEHARQRVERLKRNRLADEPGVVERPHRRDQFDEAQDSHPPKMIFALIPRPD